MSGTGPYPPGTLPAGIRSRIVAGINGLDMHVLEAGERAPGRPALLLLHGFPELAFSWRKVLLPLAAAGFHVIAPDQRGYGSTTGWDGRYDGDLGSFQLLNLVRDALGLVSALGYRSVAGVIGHDFGASVAAWCALARPDVFRSLVLMSSPFGGPPSLPFDVPDGVPAAVPDPVHRDLAALPEPRKHYQWYYSTREADGDMRGCEQGLADFLRAYYHVKSADWQGNAPYPLTSWSAAELAKLPRYYVMDLDHDMAQTVAPEMPSRAAVAACAWLTDAELGVYATEFARTGFQGALQWYRCRTTGAFNPAMQVYSGRTIDVPACFIAGRSDWGTYQKPGEFEKMQSAACKRMTGCHLVEGAGHWVQQEQPGKVAGLLEGFLAGAARSG
ncbi:MAG: alpha/beta hydrolase [Betaproteobacteria bacterium]